METKRRVSVNKSRLTQRQEGIVKSLSEAVKIVTGPLSFQVEDDMDCSK